MPSFFLRCILFLSFFFFFFFLCFFDWPAARERYFGLQSKNTAILCLLCLSSSTNQDPIALPSLVSFSRVLRAKEIEKKTVEWKTRPFFVSSVSHRPQRRNRCSVSIGDALRHEPRNQETSHEEGRHDETAVCRPPPLHPPPLCLGTRPRRRCGFALSSSLLCRSASAPRM